MTYGAGGERLRDVTHVTSAARYGQGVVDDRAPMPPGKVLENYTHPWPPAQTVVPLP